MSAQTKIVYQVGDATLPGLAAPNLDTLNSTAPKEKGKDQEPANLFITHICNNIGGWGKGFVMALSKRYPQAEKAYREWFKSKSNPCSLPADKGTPGGKGAEPFRLGEVQFVLVHTSESKSESGGSNIWVANMLAQNGIVSSANPKPIDYPALEKCLAKLGQVALSLPNSSIHMPRIGTGLAGGKWEEVLLLIERNLLEANIPVTVYDLK